MPPKLYTAWYSRSDHDKDLNWLDEQGIEYTIVETDEGSHLMFPNEEEARRASERVIVGVYTDEGEEQLPPRGRHE